MVVAEVAVAIITMKIVVMMGSCFDDARAGKSHAVDPDCHADEEENEADHDADAADDDDDDHVGDGGDGDDGEEAGGW